MSFRPDRTFLGYALAESARLLARTYPWEVEPGQELVRSLAFLRSPIGAETVVRAGYGAALCVGVAVWTLSLLAGLSVVAGSTLALLVAFGVAHAVHEAPKTLARLSRTAALGAAPDLVGRAVLRMRVTPSAERAAAFAAETGEGTLSDSLDEHVRRSRGTPTTGFSSFAAAWRDWYPSLRRAILLVEAAANAPPGERARTLDRAMTAVLDGTRDRMAEFAASIRGPATGVYAFGVLLPLALSSILPAARAAGLPASVPAIVVVYNLVLPALLLWASWRLLARRPVAFRPPRVSSAHPDVPNQRRATLAVAFGAGLLGWVLAGWLIAGWTAPLAAVGWGVGAGLLWWYRPIKEVRDRTRRIEANLPDALYLIGRRVDEGMAVEAAVEAAADEVAGETGEVLSEAARRQRQLRLDVREALLGEYGALTTVPSPRARSAAALLGTAAREGRPAGEAAVAMADHLEELRAVERDARASLATVTGTLGSTAAAFGPLVGGVTVALADGMDTAGEAVEPVPAAELGLAVGVYVLLLAVLLTGLAVGLERGLDRALVGYRCGMALISASTVYLVSYAAAGVVF